MTDTEFLAQPGDGISVASHRLRGAAARAGTILEVMGAPGHEYYRVRWQDDRETVFHPGPDAVLHPVKPRRARPIERVRAGSTARRGAAEPKKAALPQLRAYPGDRLIIRGHHLGEPDRDAEILEAQGEAGGPPFRVLWSDSGREGLLFPGTDAVIDHIAKPRRRRPSTAA